MQPNMILIKQNTARAKEVLPSLVAPRCSQVLLTGGSQVLLTGGFQIVLRDTMNFAAAVLRSVPCPSKMHKVPKQATDGGRVEPGPINPRAALQVQNAQSFGPALQFGETGPEMFRSLLQITQRD